MLKYIPYVLMFAVATMIIYGWGLWRTMHQKQDLSNMLCSKGISKVKKALKKNKSLTKKELEPFVKDLTANSRSTAERIGVTDPNCFSLIRFIPIYAETKMIKRNKRRQKKLSISKQITDRQLFLIACSTQRSFPFIGSRMIIQFDRIDRIKRMLFFHFLFLPCLFTNSPLLL